MVKELLDRANWMTYFGLISSIIGICMCYLNKIEIAIICLMVSGICDSFDGTIANKIRKGKSNAFGVQLDSLADIVSSGIFPIIICMSLGFHAIPSIIVYVIFIISGITRLAYYNVNNHLDKENFIGLPITTSTIIIPLLYFLKCNDIIFSVSILILAILYVMPIKIRKIDLKAKCVLAVLGLIIAVCLIGELI